VLSRAGHLLRLTGSSWHAPTAVLEQIGELAGQASCASSSMRSYPLERTAVSTAVGACQLDPGEPEQVTCAAEHCSGVTRDL